MHVFGKHGKEYGEFDEPHSIAINANEDKIFVSDHSNDRIQVFTPQGDFCDVIIATTIHLLTNKCGILEASITLMKDSC